MASTCPEMDRPAIGKETRVSRTRANTRVAFLFPSLARPHYWQPVFREFTRLIPDTTIFTGCWGGFVRGYEGAFKIELVDGARPFALKNNREGYKPGFYWAPLSIAVDLVRLRPDIIFTTGFTVWTICALLYKLVGRAAVIVLWDGSSPHSAFRISKVRHFLRRAMAPFFDFAVSNMHEGIEYMRDFLGIPERKLLSHPFQVADLAILDSGPCDLNLPATRRPTFLFVGTINVRKGWRYLLDAAQVLIKQGIDQFSVVFVGTGKEEEELHDRIREQGLSHIVHHVGAVPYYKIASCYRNADVFVFPTTEDVWGLVLLEAMAFGKPVVCSKYAGAREMMRHEENGFLVDPRDVDALAGYMARFIRNPKLISEYGARSRELIAPFTSMRAARVLADLAVKTHGCLREQKEHRPTVRASVEAEDSTAS